MDSNEFENFNKYEDLIKEKQKPKSYHIVELNGIEYEVMIELEKIVGAAIPKVSEIRWDTFGYMEESGQVIGLGPYNKNLSSLPENIGNLKLLQSIDLSDNPLTSLPESIGNLNSLEKLDISNNKLILSPREY